jgi:hypothetical protein
MQRKFEYMRVKYQEPNLYVASRNCQNFSSFYINDEQESRDNVNANKFWDDMGKDGWEIKGFSIVNPKTYAYVIFQREVF